MNNKDTNKGVSKLSIELIVIAIILVAVVFIFMSNTGDQEYAAAAANARVPLGEVFKGVIDKFF